MLKLQRRMSFNFSNAPILFFSEFSHMLFLELFRTISSVLFICLILHIFHGLALHEFFRYALLILHSKQGNHCYSFHRITLFFFIAFAKYLILIYVIFFRFYIPLQFLYLQWQRLYLFCSSLYKQSLICSMLDIRMNPANIWGSWWPLGTTFHLNDGSKNSDFEDLKREWVNGKSWCNWVGIEKKRWNWLWK